MFTRTIKKIYTGDRGQDIINVILDGPYFAIPIVLKRLIQKNKEWMRAQVRSCWDCVLSFISLMGSRIQRKWNRIWRKIITANYYKALDYQGVNFRVVDRRAMSARNLISEIETLYREQKERRGDPLQNQRYQLDFYFRDPDIFKTVRRLLRKQLSLSISTMGINESQIAKIIDVVDTFIPNFFCLSSYTKDQDQNKRDRSAYLFSFCRLNASNR